MRFFFLRLLESSGLGTGINLITCQLCYQMTKDGSVIIFTFLEDSPWFYVQIVYSLGLFYPVYL